MIRILNYGEVPNSELFLRSRRILDVAPVVEDIIRENSAEPAPAREVPPAPAPADPPPKAITLEKVRAMLAEKSHDGYTAEVRGLLQKYGAEKLSGVESKHYAALLKDAEVLGHAT